MTEQKKFNKTVSITIDTNEKMSADTDSVKNVCFAILKALYRQLELDKFWNWNTRNLHIQFSVDQIFLLLVFSRIIHPASIKGTFDSRHLYFEDFGDFSLDDIYHALDIICENSAALQKWIFDHSDRICTRDFSVSYFECTNYYFDIGRSDLDFLDDAGNPVDKNGDPVPAKYRKRGPEKNHRPDPIVEMGQLVNVTKPDRNKSVKKRYP